MLWHFAQTVVDGDDSPVCSISCFEEYGGSGSSFERQWGQQGKESAEFGRTRMIVPVGLYGVVVLMRSVRFVL